MEAVATLCLSVEEGLLQEHRGSIVLKRSCRLQWRNVAKPKSSGKKGLGQYKPWAQNNFIFKISCQYFLLIPSDAGGQRNHLIYSMGQCTDSWYRVEKYRELIWKDKWEIFKTLYQSKLKNMMCTLSSPVRANDNELKGIKYSVILNITTVKSDGHGIKSI